MNRKVALQINNAWDMEKMTKIMSECGFKYVAISFGDANPLIGDDWEKYINGIGELFAKNGLRCIQTHAPYYDLLISAEERNADMEKALLRSMEVTKLLGADICAVHPRSVLIPDRPRETTTDREKSLKENIIAFSPLAEAGEKLGVYLGIENLMKYPNAFPYFYSYLAEDHCALIDELKSKYVAAIWDFGHANLIDNQQDKSISVLGSRIMGTHVHNNDGIEDNHFPPFLPPPNYYVAHTVDWKKVLTALKATGYDGYLTLEAVFNFDYPVESYTALLYDNICTLDEMMKNL